MKIRIFTVFKSENCGSFLQAWALKEQLSSNENTVLFCDYVITENSLHKKIINAIKCCVKLNFKRANNILEKTKNFRKLQKELNVTHVEDHADINFFGSDTLWNFDDKFFFDNACFFTGGNVKTPCYTYSISVASTSKEKILNMNDTINNIDKFNKIAVRDNHTESLLSEIYPNKEIIRTIDPTLLVDKDLYIKNFSLNDFSHKKKLVIYHFDAIPDATWNVLKSFAKKKELEIVNVGMHGDCNADASIVPTPSNFISAFSNAEYIFTNTFHGCIFSTIFNKQFATDGVHKKKIEGFLDEFSLNDRVITSAEDIEKVFETPVDYERVNKLVNQKREKSIQYLKDCIQEVSANE